MIRSVQVVSLGDPCPPVRVTSRNGGEAMHLLARLHRCLIDIALDLIVPPWAVQAGRFRPPAGHRPWEPTP